MWGWRLTFFSEVLYDGRAARPPCTPQDPVRIGPADAERNRQGGNSAKAAPLNAGKLAPRFLPDIAAGEIAGARRDFGGTYAVVTDRLTQWISLLRKTRKRRLASRGRRVQLGRI